MTIFVTTCTDGVRRPTSEYIRLASKFIISDTNDIYDNNENKDDDDGDDNEQIHFLTADD